MSKTKLFVVHLKEIVYTAIFVALGIVLILLLIFMFLGKNKEANDTMGATTSTKTYVAGVYKSCIKLNDTVLDLEVVVDEDHINSVRLLNLDEAVSTMYPLVEPGITKIEEQLVNGVDFDHLEYSEESKHTEMLLTEAIKSALEKALAKE